MIGTQTLRRGLTGLGAAVVLALPLVAPAAHAEPDYPPVFYRISADSYQTTIGGRITFTAQTFRAGSPVSVDVTAGGSAVTSSSATANGRGVATATVAFTVEGVNRVTMAGTADNGEPLSLSAAVTVTGEDEDVSPVPAGQGSGGEAAGGSNAGGIPVLGGGLPRTGGEIAATVLVAAALLGGGVLLVVAGRRRRTS